MKEDASAATEALEPRQTKITARLNAQGAMLDELQAVVMSLGLDATRAGRTALPTSASWRR
jgi:hypothetical protein